MQITGRYRIAIPPEAVWAALSDPDVLRVCIPDCEALEKIDENRFAGSAKIKIGPLDSNFHGRVELAEWELPRRCILKGDAQSDTGFAEGEAEVLLTPEGEGTALTFSAKATVGGPLAEIDQALVDAAAQQIVENFFTRFSFEVTAAHAVPAPERPDLAAAAPPHVVQDPSEEPPLREGVAPEIWVVGLIAIIIILLVLFSLVL